MLQFTFDSEVEDGDTATAEAEGFTLTATVYRDDTSDPPWEREDGHGPVSDWRRAGYNGHAAKAPGERPLCEDGGSTRFYDFAEAVRIARRDGWGCEGGKLEGETDGAYAARAAEADFERLRRWCDDRWCYVGVAVTVTRAAVQLTGQYDHALWGIESDCGDYIGTVAAELASEALDAAKATLTTLCDCPAEA